MMKKIILRWFLYWQGFVIGLGCGLNKDGILKVLLLVFLGAVLSEIVISFLEKRSNHEK